MKNALIIGMLAGLTGGLAGTLVTRWTAPASGEPRASTDAQLALQPGTKVDDSLRSELASLRQENGELSMRLAALETRTRQATREAVEVNGDIDLAALQEQVTALASALQDPQSAQSAGLRNIVAGALKEVQKADSEKRQTERAQRDIDRIVERMGDYTLKLGLDAVQTKSMQAVLIDSSSQRGSLMASMRAGDMPRGDIREAFGNMRDKTNTALQGILSPQQYESYTEMSDDGGRFFGGGRGGRGSGSTGSGGGGSGRGGRGSR